MQFRVLSHFKSSDNILGLAALKQLNVVIHPCLNTFTMEDLTINCNPESSRNPFMIVDSDKMDQIIVKHARNKNNPSDAFLASLQFVDDLASVMSDFGEQVDQQLKQLIVTNAQLHKHKQGKVTKTRVQCWSI